MHLVYALTIERKVDVAYTTHRTENRHKDILKRKP